MKTHYSRHDFPTATLCNRAWDVPADHMTREAAKVDCGHCLKVLRNPDLAQPGMLPAEPQALVRGYTHDPAMRDELARQNKKEKIALKVNDMAIKVKQLIGAIGDRHGDVITLQNQFAKVHIERDIERRHLWRVSGDIQGRTNDRAFVSIASAYAYAFECLALYVDGRCD